MTEETTSCAAAQRGKTAPGGVFLEVLNEVFPRLKKPKATVSVCSGLADAAWCSKGHYVGGI